MEPPALDDGEGSSYRVASRSAWQVFWGRFRQDRAAVAGAAVIAILILLALSAPLIAALVGHGPNQLFPSMVNAFGLPKGPDGRFWFGADSVGRDVFVRTIYGARTSLVVAFLATGLATMIGVTLGLSAGQFRGWTDSVISRAIDIVLSLPLLLFAIGISAACSVSANGCMGGLIQPGLRLVVSVIALFTWPYIARIVRGQTLSLREKEFVESARSIGASQPRIMFREILPNVVAPIVVYTTLIIPSNIIFESSLSFLGIGIPQSTPSWGGMLATASQQELFTYAWWLMLFPGLFLLLTTLAFNLVGDGLRDALDPKRLPLPIAGGVPSVVGRRADKDEGSRAGARAAGESGGAGTRGGVMKTRRRAMVAAVAVLALVGAACGTSAPSGAGPSPSTVPTRGGVYRTAVSSFGFTGGFDPTGEYLGLAFDFYGAMLRTLVTYRHVAGSAGNVLVPDLATSVPQPTDGGLTYTFQLKPGIEFGPPVSRPITSKDVAYAFERIDSQPEVAQYAFYYDGTIAGMHQHPGAPAPISGIETPNPRTIVFYLARPTGDFLYRLAMPATAPIPQEVAKCFPTAGGYGRDVVSSGPYMIQGANEVDVSSCSTIKPMSGFDPTSHLTLVRNPNYQPSTDSSTDRSNFLNGISVIVDSNVSDIFNKVEAGTLDGSLADQPPATVIQHYATDPSLKPFLHSNSGDRTWYISMNLTTPPFDDVHVRKAVNDIIDKAALLQAWGGPVEGQIATHIMPPTVLNGRLTSSYDPYHTVGEAGDLALAQQEMMRSRYDPKHDGMCDVAVCKHIVMINRNYAPWTNMEPIVVQDLAAIGIQVVPRELETGAAYKTIETVKNDIPLALNAGWGKDYADPYTFAEPLFSSDSIIPNGTTNYSLVGLSPTRAPALGVRYPSSGVPNVNGKIDQCEAMSGTSRTNCWIAFDRDVMQNVVPWVPYLWATNVTITAPSVTRYQFDQFSGYISFTQIAVNNNASV